MLPALQDEPRRSREVSGPSLAEKRTKIDPFGTSRAPDYTLESPKVLLTGARCSLQGRRAGGSRDALLTEAGVRCRWTFSLPPGRPRLYFTE